MKNFENSPPEAEPLWLQILGILTAALLITLWTLSAASTVLLLAPYLYLHRRFSRPRPTGD